METLNRKIIYSLVLVPFIFSCFITTIITPPFEAPDENHHLDFINYFSSNLALPDQSNESTRVDGEGHQNPLYYMLTGVFVRLVVSNNKIDFLLSPNEKHIWHGGTEWATTVFDHSKIIFINNEKILFHILRGFSVLFSVITLLFLLKTTYLFTSDLKISLITVLLISTLPQFIFISSVVNNDSFVIMFITMSFYYLLKYLKNGRKKNNLYIAVFIYVLAFYTKLYSAGLIFIFLLFLLIDEREQKLSKDNIKQVALVSLAIIILISPWFIRNFVIYDSFLGNQSFIHGNKTIFDLNLSEIFSQILFLGTSFIGRFGWGNISLHLYHYLLYLFIASIVVYFTFASKEDKAKVYVNLSFVGIIIVFLQMVYYGTIDLQFQGRYIFPALIFIVVIITVSLNSLVHSIPLMQKYSVIIGVLFLLYSQNIIALITLWLGYN